MATIKQSTFNGLIVPALNEVAVGKVRFWLKEEGLHSAGSAACRVASCGRSPCNVCLFNREYGKSRASFAVWVTKTFLVPPPVNNKD